MSERDLLERARLGGIDPDLRGRRRRRRPARGKPLGMRRIRRGEHVGARGQALRGQADVHVVGREQPEAAVVMFCVVPGEEDVPVGPSVLDGAEPLRKRRPILQRLELRLRERVVVGHVGPRMRLGHAEIGQHAGVANLKSARVDNQSVKQLLLVTSLAEREQILKALDAGGLGRAARAVEQHRMRAMQQLQRTT